MIYFIADKSRDFVKIGFTAGDTANGRLTSLQVGSPKELEVIYTFPGEEVNERRLHNIFSKSYERGEWFRFTLDISIFLKLPIDDQVALSKTAYGNSLMEAMMETFLGKDADDCGAIDTSLFIKISRSDVEGSYIQRIGDIHQAIDGELDGDNEPGTIITLEIVKMTDEEYEALPEFEGW